jgi:hypothetical protein
MKNKEFWKFVGCRNFKRQVAKTYPENWNMYIVVDPHTKIRATYQKIYRKEYAKYMDSKTMSTYNEFDL